MTLPNEQHNGFAVLRIIIGNLIELTEQYPCKLFISKYNINVIFIGTQVLSTMWASESNVLVGLHDASYSIWYCPGEACSDPTVIALTKVIFDIT